MKRKKTNMVTRRVVEKRVIKIFSLENSELIELDTIETKGKLSKKELEKKYNVTNVVMEVIKEDKAVYGVPIDDFMKIAKRIDTQED